MAMNQWAIRIARALEGFALRTPAATTASTVSTRAVARERLSIILAHQRLADVDLPRMQADVLACVQKYIPLAPEQAVTFNLKQEGDLEFFEMQIALDTARRQDAISTPLP